MMMSRCKIEVGGVRAPSSAAEFGFLDIQSVGNAAGGYDGRRRLPCSQLVGNNLMPSSEYCFQSADLSTCCYQHRSNSINLIKISNPIQSIYTPYDFQKLRRRRRRPRR